MRADTSQPRQWELWTDGTQGAEREAIAQRSTLWTDLSQSLVIGHHLGQTRRSRQGEGGRRAWAGTLGQGGGFRPREKSRGGRHWIPSLGDRQKSKQVEMQWAKEQRGGGRGWCTQASGKKARPGGWTGRGHGAETQAR